MPAPTSGKIVIALYNIENKGKSETLRAFAKLLMKTYPDFKIIFANPNEIPPINDFVLVGRIEDTIIGCISQGDPRSGLSKKLIDLADKYKCEVVLCATRIKGNTVKAVDEDLVEQRGFRSIWTSTYQIANPAHHNLVNQLKAKHILELLQKLKLV